MMATKKTVKSGTDRGASAVKRPYLKQTDVPALSLDDALRVPRAILDNYNGRPTSPLHLAKVLDVDPKGSQIRRLTGAAIAFGLVEGGAQAASISVTDLAKQILRPTNEGADLAARREAVLRPRIFGDFLRQYDHGTFPRSDIGVNVLEEMGVPRNKGPSVIELIEASAASVGFVEEIKGKKYITLEGAADTSSTSSEVTADEDPTSDARAADAQQDMPESVPPKARGLGSSAQLDEDARRRKVFITHGKHQDLVDTIKKLLEFGELEAVVSVNKQSVSKPVPEKVMDDMRACGAAIIHVDADRLIEDKDGNENVVINPNVLIEIGAAMAFYGKRFILLVQESVKLPSNLQGLYEVRYAGDSLDAGTTIHLLEAIKDIKNHALPGQSVES